MPGIHIYSEPEEEVFLLDIVDLLSFTFLVHNTPQLHTQQRES
jgi:hypothetical protein